MQKVRWGILHVPWSIKALEAGKLRLCEKPIGLTSAEAQTLLEASRRHPRQKIMEAFMYRLHPQWRHAVGIVRDGGIGEPLVIQALPARSHFRARGPDRDRE